MAEIIDEGMTDSEPYLQWHPAFQAALQIELAEAVEMLQFYKEYNLKDKPLRIDTLVVKMERGRGVEKSIGRLFREYNIIEYKSPGDYASIDDFFKVLGYTCIFQSNTERVLKISLKELTMTFVLSHYPRQMLKFLRQEYGIGIELKYPGIYYLTDFMFPVQVVLTAELPSDEYVWLSRLRRNLTVEKDMKPLLEAYEGKKNQPSYDAVMDLIIRANREQYEEGLHMCEVLREIFADEIIESERRGREEGLIMGREEVLRQLIDKKQKKGKTLETIAEELEVSVQVIRQLLGGRRILS